MNVRLIASDEEVVLHVPGFAVLRAVNEAEGYYDESADGDPAEEDLYRLEVLDASSADRAAELLETEVVGPLAQLGLADTGLLRRFPATRWEAVAGPGLVTRYLLSLACALAEAIGPVERQQVLEASGGWSVELIEDRFQALPLSWRAAL